MFSENEMKISGNYSLFKTTNTVDAKNRHLILEIKNCHTWWYFPWDTSFLAWLSSFPDEKLFHNTCDWTPLAGPDGSVCEGTPFPGPENSLQNKVNKNTYDIHELTGTETYKYQANTLINSKCLAV